MRCLFSWQRFERLKDLAKKDDKMQRTRRKKNASLGPRCGAGPRWSLFCRVRLLVLLMDDFFVARDKSVIEIAVLRGFGGQFWPSFFLVCVTVTSGTHAFGRTHDRRKDIYQGNLPLNIVQGKPT